MDQFITVICVCMHVGLYVLCMYFVYACIHVLISSKHIVSILDMYIVPFKTLSPAQQMNSCFRYWCWSLCR